AARRALVRAPRRRPGTRSSAPALWRRAELRLLPRTFRRGLRVLSRALGVRRALLLRTLGCGAARRALVRAFRRGRGDRASAAAPAGRRGTHLRLLRRTAGGGSELRLLPRAFRSRSGLRLLPRAIRGRRARLRRRAFGRQTRAPAPAPRGGAGPRLRPGALRLFFRALRRGGP